MDAAPGGEFDFVFRQGYDGETRGPDTLTPMMGDDKKIRVGDVIPLDKAVRTDTYYMVIVEGEKYLVDSGGKVVLAHGPAHPAEQEPAAPVSSKPSETLKPPAMPLRYRPGTPEFQTAIEHVRTIVRLFMEQMQQHYRALTPRMVEALANNQTPFRKYLDLERGGRPGLMAFLIRELFSRSNMSERGLDILEFLTQVIAIREDGIISRDLHMTRELQKSTVTGFLRFIRGLGDNPEKRQIMLRTHQAFIDQEFQLIESQGGISFYINSSRVKALKEQRDRILNDNNHNYIESQYRRLVRSPGDIYQDNPLAYIQALAILRLISNSRKEQRGKSEDERERLLFDILSYRTGGQPPG